MYVLYFIVCIDVNELGVRYCCNVCVLLQICGWHFTMAVYIRFHAFWQVWPVCADTTSTSIIGQGMYNVYMCVYVMWAVMVTNDRTECIRDNHRLQ